MGEPLSMKKVQQYREKITSMKISKNSIHILLALFLVPYLISADEVGPLTLGNFALPISQQPAPLVGFGENIIDKGKVQLFLFADAFLGKDSRITDIIPGVLYGITNNFSFFFNAPLSPGNKNRDEHSSGLEDIFAQFEYAFYTGNNSNSVNQATVVANVAFPTGSSSKDPPTGFGSSSFFIGTTFNHTQVDWFFFTSPGAVLTTTKDGTKFGDQLLYQFGFGRNIPSPSGWIFAWMLEFDGQYSWKNKIKGRTDPDSGGNTIYMTPSLWFSSKRIILQFGAGYPMVQHLFGNQPKKFISIDFNFGVAF